MQSLQRVTQICIVGVFFHLLCRKALKLFYTTVPIDPGEGVVFCVSIIHWTKHELKQMGTLKQALQIALSFKCILTLVTFVVINLELEK